MDVVKPIFGRVGGKARLAPWIIEFIKQHQFSIYCEPFAGSAAVYFRMVSEGIFEEIKQRGHHPRIVLNDADSKIVQLFRVCRDHPELLAHAVRYTPYSREEHRIAQGKQEVETGDLDELMADIEQSRRSLVDSWQSFVKTPGGGWGITKLTLKDTKIDGQRVGGGKVPQNEWESVCDRILAASPHLQNNEAKVQALELAKVLLDLAGSEADEDIIKQQVEEARRSLVDSWMSFKYMPGDSWSIKKYLEWDRVGEMTERFNHIPDRILAASPHLQNNEAKVQALELAKVLLDLAGSGTDEDIIKQQVEEARRSLVDSWMSFKYMPGDSWGVVKFVLKHTKIDGQRVGGGKVPQNEWESVCDRILAASPHLQNNEAKVQALELAKVLLDLAGSEADEATIKQQVEEARRSLVDSWMSFVKTPGGGWGIAKVRDNDQGGIKIPENEWVNLCDRILAASPHLQNNEAKVQALELAKVLLDLAGSETDEDIIKQQVEEARRSLVNSWMSFSRNNGGWSYLLETSSSNKDRDKIGDRCASARFTHLPDRITKATNHLKRCYIENDDAVNVIKRWATPYTLFYLDPPYINCENYYAHNSNQTKDENLQLHHRLAEIANTVECAGVIVSYYPNELLDELYPEENWERHFKETIASSSGVTRTSKNRTKPKRMELLLVRKNRSESVDKPKSNYTGQLDLF